MTSLDRQADCPSCGATVSFKFAGARSVVCQYCQSVVARTDRGLVGQGRMADLIEIPTPLVVGASGKWHGEPFEVLGRLQMDRAGAPGAPWQEILVWFSSRDTTTWVAYAQGRWYATSETELAGPVPAIDSLQPGSHVDLGTHGSWVVQEIAQRRIVAGEGSLPNVPKPGEIARYADISASEGRFGTIDYGDGLEPPTLYLGRMFDPTELELDSGMPLEMPQAAVSACECPNCGASLPLVSQQTERLICQYCGTASDVSQGHLSALGPAPKPPIEPLLPLGTKGTMRGAEYIVCGFVIRSCMVEGVSYDWREFLLFGGEAVGYRWLMEEDGAWTFAQPVETGDVLDSGSGATFGGASYQLKQSVQAKIDYVIGEFYWKVAIGETVEATEFTGPGGKLSKEQSPTEVSYSFVTPVPPGELEGAFGIKPLAALAADGGSGGGSSGASSAFITIIVILVICVVLAMVLAGSCGGGSSGPSYGGGWSK